MTANVSYPRTLGPAILADLDLSPVVVVVGARQVGKSTLCSQIAEKKGFTAITLDDTELLEGARRDPAGLLRKLGGSNIFIDEAQRVPALFLAVKAAVDRSQLPGQFLLCGSNQPEVRRAVGDSLIGRAVYRQLHPLTLNELRFDTESNIWGSMFEWTEHQAIEELSRRADNHGALNWKEVVSTGGFPRAVNAPAERRRRLLDDYVSVFASRDIQEIIGIESTERFETFVRLLATRVLQPVNYSSLASDLGLSVNTVRRWTDALIRAYLIDLIPAYSRNAGHRVIKSPKIAFVDCALAQAAARETEPSGFHLENLVATDLAVWQAGSPNRAFHHWRLSTGQEVDFVLEQAGALLPIEVKTSSAVAASDARHLRTFLEQHPTAKRGLILTSDATIRLISTGVIAAPWWSVL